MSICVPLRLHDPDSTWTAWLAAGPQYKLANSGHVRGGVRVDRQTRQNTQRRKVNPVCVFVQGTAALKVDTLTAQATASIVHSLMQVPATSKHSHTRSRTPEHTTTSRRNSANGGLNNGGVSLEAQHLLEHDGGVNNGGFNLGAQHLLLEHDAELESLLNDPFSKVTRRRGTRPLHDADVWQPSDYSGVPTTNSGAPTTKSGVLTTNSGVGQQHSRGRSPGRAAPVHSTCLDSQGSTYAASHRVTAVAVPHATASAAPHATASAAPHAPTNAAPRVTANAAHNEQGCRQGCRQGYRDDVDNTHRAEVCASLPQQMNGVPQSSSSMLTRRRAERGSGVMDSTQVLNNTLVFCDSNPNAPLHSSSSSVALNSRLAFCESNPSATLHSSSSAAQDTSTGSEPVGQAEYSHTHGGCSPGAHKARVTSTGSEPGGQAEYSHTHGGRSPGAHQAAEAAKRLAALAQLAIPCRNTATETSGSGESAAQAPASTGATLRGAQQQQTDVNQTFAERMPRVQQNDAGPIPRASRASLHAGVTVTVWGLRSEPTTPRAKRTPPRSDAQDAFPMPRKCRNSPAASVACTELHAAHRRPCRETSCPRGTVHTARHASLSPTRCLQLRAGSESGTPGRARHSRALRSHDMRTRRGKAPLQQVQRQRRDLTAPPVLRRPVASPAQLPLPRGCTNQLRLVSCTREPASPCAPPARQRPRSAQPRCVAASGRVGRQSGASLHLSSGRAESAEPAANRREGRCVCGPQQLLNMTPVKRTQCHSVPASPRHACAGPPSSPHALPHRDQRPPSRCSRGQSRARAESPASEARDGCRGRSVSSATKRAPGVAICGGSIVLTAQVS